MSDSIEYIALDVGGKRIGVARGNSIAKIAEPLTTVIVDGTEVDQIKKLVDENSAEKIVVGLPRNQSGEETEQSQTIRAFTESLNNEGLEIIFQDESLTSVNAEEELRQSRKNFDKGDIDSHAAAAILNDYLGSV